MHGYQKQRVMTFLNPASDALGAGWNITQAEIALGSGGLTGKGLVQGTQSRLNFLPEKQTDFIGATLGEELGFVGFIALLLLFAVVIGYGVRIAMASRSQFGRLVAMGVTLNFFFYIMINAAMVMGLIPVVGIPMPLISYGGTAMLTVMFGFGLLMSVHVHRQVEIPRHAGGISSRSRIWPGHRAASDIRWMALRPDAQSVWTGRKCPAIRAVLPLVRRAARCPEPGEGA